MTLNQDSACRARPLQQRAAAHSLLLYMQNAALSIPHSSPFHTPPYSRRRAHRPLSSPATLLCLVSLLFSVASAAFIEFDNCLPGNIVNSHPLYLQWTPLLFDAKLTHNSNSHYLSITTYGNVSGQATEGTYPSPTSPTWRNPESTFGKLIDVNDATQKFTSLRSSYGVLTFTSYTAPESRFCQSNVQPACPIPPAFDGNISDPSTLPVFTVGHRFSSSYAFSTITSKITITSPFVGTPLTACVSAAITPQLGETLSNVISYLPVLVLVLVAIATVLAATASPWGTTDVFKWTSNYGRDEDLLRLVTPGFGDCLQYIQFVVLSGSLSLAYPGFYQPVVSQISWAALMFKESFVSHGKGVQAVVDGIYVTHGAYGLSRMRQLVGISTDYDVWAGMAIWTLVITIVVVTLCQIGFFFKWGFRMAAKTPAEDLRSKNWPFTGGNVVRIVFNFFLLPIASLSMFQLIIAFRSPGVVIAFAVIFLVAILAFSAWTVRLIFKTKPRSHLFDDLPTLLLYGPLYNTYSDGAAPFALIPALLTFVRGIAIGAVQASGIAQVVILAICEVVLILTLHAFRPFQSPTSMNAYHTIFAIVRLVTILLMVAFATTISVSEGVKGWIGYVILLLHALVLVLGFFVNALQTIIEVAARLAGAGGDKLSGAPTRGGLTKAFGVRQLSRRQRRPNYRLSQQSDAAILTEVNDAKSIQYGGRSRSISASSAMMLSQHRASDARVSSHLDRSPSGGTGLTEAGLEQSPRMYLPVGGRGGGGAPGRKPQLGIKTGEPADPYYRPPRPRRQTGEFMTPGDKSRGSADWTAAKLDEASPPQQQQQQQQRERSGSNGRPISALAQQAPPNPAYLRTQGDSETNLSEARQPNVDYAVREVDYYYGVRGPALSSQPHRKLRTGPADPVGPVSSATGWFKNMLGRKTKDSGKGFEVVRSSRAPPAGLEDEPMPLPDAEPYHDSPPQQQEAYLPGQRTRSNTGDTEPPDDDDERSLGDSGDDVDEDVEGVAGTRISDVPPLLAPIGAVGEMDLPSRWSSKISRRSGKSGSGKRQAAAGAPVSIPLVPRKPLSRPMSTEAATVGAEEWRPSTETSTQAGSSGGHAATGSSVTGSSLERPQSSEDRPTSYGYVNQYITSDRIQQPALGEDGGSLAAVFDSTRSPRRSRDV